MRQAKINLRNNVELIARTGRIRRSKGHNEGVRAVLYEGPTSGKCGRDEAQTLPGICVPDQNGPTVNGLGSRSGRGIGLGVGIGLRVGVGGGRIRRGATTNGST